MSSARIAPAAIAIADTVAPDVMDVRQRWRSTLPAAPSSTLRDVRDALAAELGADFVTTSRERRWIRREADRFLAQPDERLEYGRRRRR